MKTLPPHWFSLLLSGFLLVTWMRFSSGSKPRSPPEDFADPSLIESDRQFLAELKTQPSLHSATPSPTPAAAGSVLWMQRQRQAEKYMRAYLAACMSDDAAAELAFYAGEVEFFESGRLSRTGLETELRALRERWGWRRYELAELRLESSAPREVCVALRIAYRLENARQTRTGQIAKRFTLRYLEGIGWRLVRLKEVADVHLP